MVILFIHPGREKTNNKWNTGTHRRAFIECPGEYISSPNGNLQKGDLWFWGEWEPSTKMCLLNNPIAPNPYPQYLHTPDCSIFSKGFNYPPNAQNTDPCVFDADKFNNPKVNDAPFKFFVCRQEIGYIRDLNEGDLILFGSEIKINGQYDFLLDTVFVVGDNNTPYSSTNPLTRNQLGVYYDYVYRRGFAQNRSITNLKTNRVFYKGATPNNPIKKEDKEDMYSFSPAMLKDSNNNKGFQRPNLRGLGVNNPLSQLFNNSGGPMRGPKKDNDILDTKQVWNDIVAYIHSLGLVQGTHFIL